MRRKGILGRVLLPPNREDRDLARAILPNAGTMIGVCTTLVGLVKLLEGRIGPSRVDEYGALAGVVFLASALLAYLALRSPPTSLFGRRCEHVADLCFVIGLISIVIIALLFAFEQI